MNFAESVLLLVCLRPSSCPWSGANYPLLPLPVLTFSCPPLTSARVYLRLYQDLLPSDNLSFSDSSSITTSFWFCLSVLSASCFRNQRLLVGLICSHWR